MGWIDLAQDRDQWWALVNTVMNFWLPQIAGKKFWFMPNPFALCKAFRVMFLPSAAHKCSIA
jgi:hypothetical protein